MYYQSEHSGRTWNPGPIVILMCKDKSLLQAQQRNIETVNTGSKDHVLQNDPAHNRGLKHTARSWDYTRVLISDWAIVWAILDGSALWDSFVIFSCILLIECFAGTCCFFFPLLCLRNNKTTVKHTFKFWTSNWVLTLGSICLRDAVYNALICAHCPDACASSGKCLLLCYGAAQCSMWLFQGTKHYWTPDREASNNHWKDKAKNTSQDILHQRACW